MIRSIDRDGRRSSFARADTDGFLDIGNENLSITDFTGVRALDDGCGHSVSLRVINDDLDLHLWQEINGVLRTAIDFGVPFLAAKALDFGDCHALHTHLGEGFFDFLKLEWFDDRFDFFHSWADYKINKASTVPTRSSSALFADTTLSFALGSDERKSRKTLKNHEIRKGALLGRHLNAAKADMIASGPHLTFSARPEHIASAVLIGAEE